MPAISASAPGKIILFGEHAVVYNRPAIAVPVLQVSAHATIVADPLAPPHTVWIEAPMIGLTSRLEDLDPEHPIRVIFRLVMEKLNISHFPSAKVKLTSTIPIASGLGSSSATSVALTRVISTFLGRPFPDEAVNQVAFETEKIHHGHPSGIDNTVTTFARPIYYVKDQPMRWLTVGEPLVLVIGDSGEASSTAAVVSDLRQRWSQAPEAYEPLFDRVGEVAVRAREAIDHGDLAETGRLMSQNHALLQELDVSSNKLDQLVLAAMKAGALGAKMSGGGRGGNMIALAQNENEAVEIAGTLEAAGAVHALVTTVPTSGGKP